MLIIFSECLDERVIVFFSFMSFCNFLVYEVYFGWSKFFWVVFVRMSYKNLVVFSDIKEGDGIEVWINFD